jgi:hypothetical protein
MINKNLPLITTEDELELVLSFNYLTIEAIMISFILELSWCFEPMEKETDFCM